MPRSSFRDLRVWQEAVKLTSAIYKGTSSFPKDEIYGLRQQIRRAAVSVASNIAEGKGHHSDGDFLRFLMHARGSLLELQTQLLISLELAYLSEANGEALLAAAERVGRSLNGLINSMSQRSA